MTTETKKSGPTVFMRGGSSTSSYEQQKADDKLKVETAQRRAYVDKMKKVAKERPNEASMYSHKMGTTDNNASIVLQVMGKDSANSQEWEVCEINMASLPDGTPEMTLTLVCPVCAITRGKGHAASQMTLHSSSRPFTLDMRGPGEGGVAGTIWVNPLNKSDVVHLAGTVTMHGPASCPQCAWKFIIDNNKLRGY